MAPPPVGATFCGFLGALAATALFLTYGILAVIPDQLGPGQDLRLGVPLIVLGGIGVAGLAGSVAGAIVGFVALDVPLAVCAEIV